MAEAEKNPEDESEKSENKQTFLTQNTTHEIGERFF